MPTVPTVLCTVSPCLKFLHSRFMVRHATAQFRLQNRIRNCAKKLPIVPENYN
jgi:hypothetical protein